MRLDHHGTMDDFARFRLAKQELAAAYQESQEAWVAARGGDSAARRRYRTALAAQVRAEDAMRHLRMMPVA